MRGAALGADNWPTPVLMKPSGLDLAGTQSSSPHGRHGLFLSAQCILRRRRCTVCQSRSQRRVCTFPTYRRTGWNQ